MYKYINFNNLRKKKEFVGGGEGGTHLRGNIKSTQENTKRRKKNTKNNLFY